MREEDKIITELQTAISRDRMTIKSLKDEIAKITRDRERAVSDLANYERMKKSVLDEINDLSNKKNTLYESLRLEAETLSEKKSVIESRLSEACSIENKASAKLEEANRLVECAKKMADKNKAESARLAKVDDEVTKEKNIATAKGKALDIEIAKAKNEADGYRQKQSLLEKKQSEVLSNLDKTKRIIEGLNKRTKETDLQKIRLQQTIDKYEGLIRDTENINLELCRFREKESEVERLKASFQKMINEQKKKDAEIEIRRLRVEKLIREKGVADELKNLEAELAK